MASLEEHCQKTALSVPFQCWNPVCWLRYGSHSEALVNIASDANSDFTIILYTYFLLNILTKYFDVIA